MSKIILVLSMVYFTSYMMVHGSVDPGAGTGDNELGFRNFPPKEDKCSDIYDDGDERQKCPNTCKYYGTNPKRKCSAYCRVCPKDGSFSDLPTIEDMYGAKQEYQKYQPVDYVPNVNNDDPKNSIEITISSTTFYIIVLLCLLLMILSVWNIYYRCMEQNNPAKYAKIEYETETEREQLQV